MKKESVKLILFKYKRDDRKGNVQEKPVGCIFIYLITPKDLPTFVNAATAFSR
jgi:hypothetical protein